MISTKRTWRIEIGQQILQLILYPPFLASFHLQADDLVVCMNGQKLTHTIGKLKDIFFESIEISNLKYSLELHKLKEVDHFAIQ